MYEKLNKLKIMYSINFGVLSTDSEVTYESTCIEKDYAHTDMTVYGLCGRPNEYTVIYKEFFPIDHDEPSKEYINNLDKKIYNKCLEIQKLLNYGVSEHDISNNFLSPFKF